MRDSIPDHWLHPGSLAHARQVQAELAALVRAEDDPADSPAHAPNGAAMLPPRVAGADTSSAFRVPDAPLHAGIVLLQAPELRVIGAAGATRPPDFPYVPGFLGFREVPVLLDALRRLLAPPDLIVLDGHGQAHPRGLGIACHLGVLLDVPAIGVAKSILVGQVEGTLGEAPGSRAPLVWQGRTIGIALRTRPRANPVFVSVGHRVSLDTAVRWVLGMVRGYRLPEPTRLAHEESNRRRRASQAETPSDGEAALLTDGG